MRAKLPPVLHALMSALRRRADNTGASMFCNRSGRLVPLRGNGSVPDLDGKWKRRLHAAPASSPTSPGVDAPRAAKDRTSARTWRRIQGSKQTCFRTTSPGRRTCEPRRSPLAPRAPLCRFPGASPKPRGPPGARSRLSTPTWRYFKLRFNLDVHIQLEIEMAARHV